MTAQTEAAQAPDLLYSEAEEDLRSAVRSLLADRADAPTVIAAVESDTPYDLRLWESLAAGIGAAGLLVPEKLGGQGATHREAAVVLEELGRSVAPAPYLTSAVVATEILLALADDGGPAAALLGELAEGRRTAVLALPFATAPADAAASTTGTLERTVTGVADAAAADVLLVPTAEGLYAVEAAWGRCRRPAARPARPDPPARHGHPHRGHRHPARRGGARGRSGGQGPAGRSGTARVRTARTGRVVPDRDRPVHP